MMKHTAAFFSALVFCALFAQARPAFGQSGLPQYLAQNTAQNNGQNAQAAQQSAAGASSDTASGASSGASTGTAGDTASSGAQDETASAQNEAAANTTEAPADSEAAPTQLGRSDASAQPSTAPKKPAEEFLLPPQQTGTPTPEPYDIDPPYNIGGLKPWAYFTVRFLAVTVGVFPFSILVTSIGFDIYRTAIHNGDPNQNRYYPLVAGANKEPYSGEDVATVLAAAAGLSLAVGITDLIIALVKYSRKRAINELFTRTVP